MALFQCNYYSPIMRGNQNIAVIIPTPQGSDAMEGIGEYFKPGIKYQTLYLLHGMFSDYSDWMRFTSIERYAQKHRLAIVMPSAATSFYQNLPSGAKYLTYISEELPLYVQTLFPLSAERENNFTAGMSMGGYGALKVALNKPENFSCAVSLSGSVDVVRRIKENKFHPMLPHSLEDLFGDLENVENTDANVFYRIKSLKDAGLPIPKVFMSCGTDDMMYPFNKETHNKLESLGVDVHFEEHPGTHNWEYWDEHIQRALDWLPLKNGVIDE